MAIQNQESIIDLEGINEVIDTQKEATQQDIDFVNQKVQIQDSLENRDIQANAKLGQFEAEFSDITNVLNLSDNLDKSITQEQDSLQNIQNNEINADSILQEHENNISENVEINPQTQEQNVEDSQEIQFQNNNIDFLNNKVKQLDNLQDKDIEANTKKQQFEREFDDIENILQLSNKVDNAIDSKESTRDTKELEKKPINLDKEKEDLDKALDNLVKVRSLADLIKAMYILNEALYAINEKKEKPKENKAMQTLIKAFKEGKANTLEYTTLALQGIKESKEKLDSYVKTRQKEKEMQSSISSESKKYKLALSPTQKQNHANKLQKHLEYANKELPNFAKNYPKTSDNAKKILKEHEKKLALSKQQDKGRIL